MYTQKGKKTIEWERVREIIKKDFERMDVVRCEVCLKGCWMDNALSFAHKDKRRFLSPDELYHVVVACIPCHNQIEKLPRLEMRAKVENIIQSRNVLLQSMGYQVPIEYLI